MPGPNVITNEPSSTPPTLTDAAAEQLTRQLEELNARMAKLDGLQASLESLTAIAVDVVDEQAKGLGGSSTPPDQRLAGLATLVERLTRRETLAALTAVADRAPQLERLASFADAAPDAFATLVDVFDEWAQRCGEQGIDLVEAARRGLQVALWLGQRISEDELERLGLLLQSDVLNPDALQVVGNAATALAESQKASHEAPRPPRAGLFAALRALGDPETQQSLAFAMHFAQAFGARVGRPCSGAPEDKETP